MYVAPMWSVLCADSHGNSVDRRAATLFTRAMSETTTTTDMPTDTEIRQAMTTLDRMICAAEDSGLFSTKTIEELSTAYDHMDHIAKFVTTVKWPIEELESRPDNSAAEWRRDALR